MEVIIKGKRVDTQKENCFENIDALIAQTLSDGTPDIRRVIKSLDKLGKYMVNDKHFLIPELTELGFTEAEAHQIKEEALPVITEEELFKKMVFPCLVLIL